MKLKPILQWLRNLPSNRNFQIALILFIIAIIPRIVFWEHGLWWDEGRALSISRNLLRGNGMVFHGRVMIKHPFMFYLIIACSFLIFGLRELAGMVVVTSLGALTISLAYLIGQEIYNRWSGLFAAAFMIFSSNHWFISCRITNDVPVVFFVTLSFYLFVRAINREEKGTFYLAAASTGMALTTKLTAGVLLPSFFLILLLRERKNLFFNRKNYIFLLIIMLPFSLWEIRNYLVTGAPALAGLFEDWVLEGARQQTGALANPNSPYDYLKRLPTILGLPFYLFFVWGAFSGVLDRLNSKNDAYKLLTLILMLPAAFFFLAGGEYLGLSSLVFAIALTLLWIASLILVASEIWHTIFLVIGAGYLAGSAILGIHLLSILALGCMGLWLYQFIGEESRIDDTILIFLFITFIALTVKRNHLSRYFLPFVPLAGVIAGKGLDKLRQGLAKFHKCLGIAIVIIIVISSWLVMYPAGAKQIRSKAKGFEGLEEAGRFIKENSREDTVVMAGSINQILWYSDREVVRFPNNKSDLREFIETEGVDLIVIDVWEVSQPNYAHLGKRPLYFIDNDQFTPVKAVYREMGGKKTPVVLVLQPNFE